MSLLADEGALHLSDDDDENRQQEQHHPQHATATSLDAHIAEIVQAETMMRSTMVRQRRRCTELQMRCHVDRAFGGIGRELGLKWLSAARYNDLASMRTLYGDIAAQSVARYDEEGKAKDQEQEETTSQQNPTTTPRRVTQSQALLRLLHYNGQGTSYGFIGNIALHWACANNSPEMVAWLLRKGSAVNCQNFGGSTPLHSACANGADANIVMKLLQRGANPSIVDCCNDRALDVLSRDSSDATNVRAVLQCFVSFSQLTEGPVMKSFIAKCKGKSNNDDDDDDAELDAAIRKTKSEPLMQIAKTVTTLSATANHGGTQPTKQQQQAPLERSELEATVKRIVCEYKSICDAALKVDTFANRLHTIVRRRQLALQRRVHEKPGLLDRAASEEGQKKNKKKENASEEERKLDGEREGHDNVASGNDESDDDDPDMLELKMMLHQAQKVKQKGNTAFQAGDHKTAIRHYTLALQLCPPPPPPPPENNHQNNNDDNSLMAILYSNRAACYLSTRQFMRAVKDAHDAMAIAPSYAKAYHRLGTALLELGHCGDAVGAFEEGLAQVERNFQLQRREHTGGTCNGEEEERRRAEQGLREGIAAAQRKAASQQEQLHTDVDAAALEKNESGEEASDEEEVPRHDRRPQLAASATPFPSSSPSSTAYVPPLQRKPWFDCGLCENRTRDKSSTQCCGAALCGTCLSRGKHYCTSVSGGRVCKYCGKTS